MTKYKLKMFASARLWVRENADMAVCAVGTELLVLRVNTYNRSAWPTNGCNIYLSEAQMGAKVFFYYSPVPSNEYSAKSSFKNALKSTIMYVLRQ